MGLQSSRAVPDFYYSNNVVANDMTACNGHGTPYPFSSKELSILQDPRVGPGHKYFRRNPPKISIQQAYERLCTYQRADARSRSRWKALHEAMNCEKLTWHLIIKVFNDLDACYFNGDLRRRVYVRWKPFRGKEQIAMGMTEPVSLFHKRVTIYLRTNYKWEALPRTTALGTLVHEMLHAYFLIHCENAKESGCVDPAHGPIFTAAARMLERLTSLDLTTKSMLKSYFMIARSVGLGKKGVRRWTYPNTDIELKVAWKGMQY